MPLLHVFDLARCMVQTRGSMQVPSILWTICTIAYSLRLRAPCVCAQGNIRIRLDTDKIDKAGNAPATPVPVDPVRNLSTGWGQPRYRPEFQDAGGIHGAYQIYRQSIRIEHGVSILRPYKTSYDHANRFVRGTRECGLSRDDETIRLVNYGGHTRLFNVYCRRVVFPFSFQATANSDCDDCEDSCTQRMHDDMEHALPSDDSKLDDICEAYSGAYVKLVDARWLTFTDGIEAATCVCWVNVVMLRVRKRLYQATDCDICNVQNKIAAKLTGDAKIASLQAANGSMVQDRWPWFPTDYPAYDERNVHCDAHQRNCWGDRRGYSQGQCEGTSVPLSLPLASPLP